MITTLCVIVLVLFSLLVRSNHKHNYLPVFGILTPFSISAQNGELGGGSNGEIIWWLFVLGFLVSIMPERKKPFEQKAMRVLKITILGILAPLSISAQTHKEICEMQKLPDFSKAVRFDTNEKIEGWNDLQRPYVPVLDVRHVGEYNTEWYLYRNDTLYFFGKIKMLDFSKYPAGSMMSEREIDRDSQSCLINGHGRWYCRILDVKCGYVYTYNVASGGRFSWQLEQLNCN